MKSRADIYSVLVGTLWSALLGSCDLILPTPCKAELKVAKPGLGPRESGSGAILLSVSTNMDTLLGKRDLSLPKALSDQLRSGCGAETFQTTTCVTRPDTFPVGGGKVGMGRKACFRCCTAGHPSSISFLSVTPSPSPPDPQLLLLLTFKVCSSKNSYL